MSTIRFYSDPHFHHRNMAIKRGFTDEVQMNNHIVTEKNFIIGFCIECISFYQFIRQKIQERNNVRYARRNKQL